LHVRAAPATTLGMPAPAEPRFEHYVVFGFSDFHAMHVREHWIH
jgi:hypothetical protein